MTPGSPLVKNTIWLMMATMGQKVVAFLAFYLIARLTGPEITGSYFFGVSVTSIFVVFSDLGMTPVIIRALAGNREDAEHLLGTALRLKFFLVPMAVIASLSYGFLTNQPPVIMGTIALACVAMSADAFHLILYGSLRGKQNLKPEALGMFIGQVLSGLAGVTAALMHWGPMGLAGALMFGSLWNVLWAFKNLGKYNIHILPGQWLFVKKMAYEAWPFAVAGLAVKVYSYIDSLMLHAYQGSVAVGYYAVAYKMTYAMQFLPLTFTAALYPALSSAYAKKEHEELKKVFIGSLRFMALASFPIAAGLSALAPRLIEFFYGQRFMGSIPAMEVLPWVLIPIFMDFPVGALLNGTQKAHLKTLAMVITMIINVALNFVLVPKFGPLGAAWAGVVSFWSLFAMGVMFTYGMAGGLRHYFRLTFKALLGAGVSWCVWRYVGVYMPLPVSFVFGAGFAILVAIGLRLLQVKDIQMTYHQLRQRFIKPDQIHAG